MRAFRTDTGHLLRLDPGEEIVGTVLGFCRAARIEGGTANGIGTLRNTTLGYFDRERKEYARQLFEDDLELVSLVGNITVSEGAPLLHAHVVLSGPRFETYGGHLFSAEVAATVELHLAPSGDSPRIVRVLDERTGLRLIADPDPAPPHPPSEPGRRGPPGR